MLGDIMKSVQVAYRYVFHSAVPQDSDTEEDEEDEQEDIEMTQEGGDNHSISSAASHSRVIAEDEPNSTMQDLEETPHSEWIKIEPQDGYDMEKPDQDLTDDEVTDHEGPDEGGDESESWTDLLNSATSAPPVSIYIFKYDNGITPRSLRKWESRVMRWSTTKKRYSDTCEYWSMEQELDMTLLVYSIWILRALLGRITSKSPHQAKMRSKKGELVDTLWPSLTLYLDSLLFAKISWLMVAK
jgi:hypothetical protein